MTDETITPDAAGTVEAANDQAEVPQTDPSATAEGHEEPAPSGKFTLRQPGVIRILQQQINYVIYK